MFIYKLFCGFFVRKRAKTVGKDLHVNHFSIVSQQTELGDNVNFNGIRISGSGMVKIGNNFHSGRGCLMISQIHDYDGGDALPYGDTYIAKPILIGDNVWIGDRVIVLGGAKIGEGAIIQAGSVVVGEIPACSIAGGHPAKVFKKRDIEHYDRLKQEKRYK